MIKTGDTIGVEGWTVVHCARQKHYDDCFYGQFLGARKDDCTGNTKWIVGRMHTGRSMDDGFVGGGWDSSTRFAGPRSTDNADDALKAYIEMSRKTFVWDHIFEQRAGEAIDQYWAGPEVPGARRMSAGWQVSDPGPSVPFGSHTIYLPLHEAKRYLLGFLRSTELNAKAHLTPTIDRHQAVERVVGATGPVRFHYGYNIYWLAAEGTD